MSRRESGRGNGGGSERGARQRSRIGRIARRTFLIGSAAIAGGVAFGVWRYRTPYDNPLEAAAAGDPNAATLTPYVLIDPSGVTIITPRSEMGQGVQTTLAALVAEEMDLDLAAVRVDHGPASPAYWNQALLREAVPFLPTDHGFWAETARDATAIPAKFLGMQLTGGSSSIPDAFEKMRRAGASARAALVRAAADRLGVAPDALSTEAGQVLGPDGARLRYEDLAVAAAEIGPIEEAPLKPRAAWRLLGRPVDRVDVVAKSTGTAMFGVDVRLPGMLFATVKMNPNLGAALTGFDASEARAMRGVVEVVELTKAGIGGGVAIVADNTWRAFRAAHAVRCDWAEAAYPKSTAGLHDAIAASLDDPDAFDGALRDDGDAAEAVAEAGAAAIEAAYVAPFLAHATLEPMNAVAWLQPDAEGGPRLDVWAGTQAPTQARADAAEIAGLDPERVHLTVPFLGGGFGRRAEMDFVRQAVEIATLLPGRPIKLTWSREEDMTHDQYRPAARAHARGALGADGLIAALELTVASPSVMASQLGRIGISPPGPDGTLTHGAWDQPYTFENFRVVGQRTPPLTPITSWRAVGNSFNGFFLESFIDELAHAAGADPLTFRLDHIAHGPSRGVLEAVRALSGWDDPTPDGHGRGVAFTLSFGVPTAEVVEVANTDRGLRIERVSAAVDVGLALDPRIIEAQVSSAIVYGLSAAIQGEITFEGGAVEQRNFPDYDALRIDRTPPIAVAIREAGDEIRGIGEPGLPPIAPALANAIFAATGRRLRGMPFAHEVAFA